MEKGKDGFSKVTRTADLPTISELAKEGIPLGSLWYSQHFGGLAAKSAVKRDATGKRKW